MPAPNFAITTEGEWFGLSRLNVTEPDGNQEIYECESTMQVRPFDGYAVIDYTWEHDDEPQTGSLILVTTNGTATAAWSDSWHQNVAVMPLEGTDGAVFSVQGSYPTTRWGTWGWRIEFIAEQDGLRMLMTNISPEGEEQWAVDAAYKRVRQIPVAG